VPVRRQLKRQKSVKRAVCHPSGGTPAARVAYSRQTMDELKGFPRPAALEKKPLGRAGPSWRRRPRPARASRRPASSRWRTSPPSNASDHGNARATTLVSIGLAPLGNEAARVSHLLRRTTFGATAEELDKAQTDGYAKTVDRLLETPIAEPPALAGGDDASQDNPLNVGASSSGGSIGCSRARRRSASA